MGFFGKLKRAFGLGSSEYDYNDAEAFSIDATVTPLSRPEDQSEQSVSTPLTVDNIPPETTEATPPIPVDAIFNTVVSIFNKAMPSFLGDSF